MTNSGLNYSELSLDWWPKVNDFAVVTVAKPLDYFNDIFLSMIFFFSFFLNEK